MVQSPRPPRRKRRAGKDAHQRPGPALSADGARPGKAWGGRFEAATHRLVEAYTSSAGTDERLLPFDLAASIAHARMLGETGIISKRDAAAIERGLGQIGREYDRGEFVLRDGLEDVHLNVEARLAEKIGPAAGRLHTARSRNDQVATDFRLYAKSANAEAIAALLELQSALLDLAEANRDAVMPGYTHLQRAQPVLLAHHLLAYVEMFDRDVARFAAAFVAADRCPLGSGALAGVPYPVDRSAVAAELGFAGITANSIDAVSDRDFAVDFVVAAATAMAHVSRLAEDIVLWSSAEFGFIRLPDAFATGSSIMPQKKNPDVAELARGRAGRVIGCLVALLTMLKGLPLSYNRDLQEDKPAFFEAEDILLSTLEVFAAMLPHVEVNAERAAKAAGANYSLATDLADYLVRKGLPFREAHEAVGRLVRHAEANGAELGELTLAEMRTFSPLFGEDARRIDVTASLRSRDVPGGTAPRRVAQALRQARRRVDKIRGIAGKDA
ncbi:MAG: argininosuccinate lyase [Dehalococcoidia bacterium]